MPASAIVSVAEMRALEASATAAGISEAQLQDRAGAVVAEEVAQLLAPGAGVVVLVGRGNNGRDGALAAGRLAHHGHQVVVVLVQGHAVTADELQALRASAVRLVDADRSEDVREVLSRVHLAVDALAGIGAQGALREPLLSIARALNAARQARGSALVVLALDIPSGIDSDTGDVPGVAVSADLTITLGAVKRGLLRFPAAERVGRLVPRDIGIPLASSQALPVHVLREKALAADIPPRPADAHKYQHGRALLVVGCDQYPGAAALAASACVRAGAGLVTVITTSFARSIVASRVVEATFFQDELDDAVLADRVSSAQALVVGCGLGRDERAIRLVHSVLGQHERLRRTGARVPPLILDGDALYALTLWDRWWERLAPEVILTPHAGELQRLLEHSGLPYVPSNPSFPWEVAGQLARAYNGVLVSKGPFTCVAEPGGRVEVWTRPNGALATAGTGDVLAGLIGGLAAQGAPPWAAARAGVVGHARSAESLMAAGDLRSITAGDLVPELPRQLAVLQRLSPSPAVTNGLV